MPGSAQQPVTDRRIRKTRRAIRDAFVELVLEHGYEAVSVEAVIQRADIVRATFYAHYRDKADLLASIVRELTEDLVVRLSPVAARGTSVHGKAILELFRHAGENRELYRVTLTGGDNRPRQAYADQIAEAVGGIWSDLVRDSGTTPRFPPAALTRAWTGSHLALLQWWLEEAPHLAAEEVALLEVRLLIDGYPAALGFEPGGLRMDPAPEFDTVIAKDQQATG